MAPPSEKFLNHDNLMNVGCIPFTTPSTPNCSRSMEYFGTVCCVLQNMFWLFKINLGVAHLLTELPRDSRWRKEEWYFSAKEQCSENTPLRTEQ